MKFITKKGNIFKVNLQSLVPIILITASYIVAFVTEDSGLLIYTNGVVLGSLFFSMEKGFLGNWPPIFDKENNDE